jgi:Protein of unknown function (DUF4244)
MSHPVAIVLTSPRTGRPPERGKELAMPAVWKRLLSRLYHDERGQGTVEYFLVILAATALAVILFRWMQGSGGTSIISTILGRVVQWIAGQF